MEELIAKYQKLDHEFIRISAQLSERNRVLEEIRDECRKLGYDPDSLDTIISELESKIESLQVTLGEQLTLLEEELAKCNE